MKFHWMIRDFYPLANDLKKFSKIVNDVGYESLLLVYDSSYSDACIKVASTINKKHKFKYMIAIRPYAISPEYLSMIHASFEEIAKDRVVFNIVPGKIAYYETSLSHLVEIRDIIESSEKREQYSIDWLKKYNDLSIQKELPNLFVSGHTNLIRSTVKEFNFLNILMIDDYLKRYNNEDFIKLEKQMVSCAISIKKNKLEKEKFLLSRQENEKRWSIVGDEEYLIQKIKEMENMGITDILFHALPGEKDLSSIHKFIKKIIKEGIPL